MPGLHATFYFTEQGGYDSVTLVRRKCSIIRSAVCVWAEVTFKTLVQPAVRMVLRGLSSEKLADRHDRITTV